MEAVVGEALGDIFGSDPGGLGHGAEIEDHLVGHPAALPGVEHREVRIEATSHVVGGQDRDLGGATETFRSHEPEVGIGDHQDAGRAERGARDRAHPGRRPRHLQQRVVGEEWCEMRLGSHRAHPRAPSAVGDGEGLVQVEMTDIGAEVGRPGQPDQGVQIGAIDVHLAPVAMDDPRQLLHSFLEHAMGRRIRHHGRGQVLGVLCGLRLQVCEVDVDGAVGSHHHHPHTCHHRRRGIGPMCRSRDEADIASLLPA